MKKWMCIFSALLFLGCSSKNTDDDEELITQPVTNNPLLIPQNESGISGLPSTNQHRNR